MQLLGRTAEQARLQTAIDAAIAGLPQLVVLFGRRRVGKTFLVRHVLASRKGVRSLYIAAERRRSRDEAARFSSEVERVYGRRPEPDWRDIFATLVDLGRSQPVVVFIDEAPYLIDEDASWSASLQHAWDGAQRDGPCQLLICLTGSAVTTLSKVISSGGPLYGRTTDRIRLDPFDLPTVHELLRAPTNPLATIESYAACGGYPLLHKQWDPQQSAQHNLERLAADPLAPLATDANALLLDLPDPTGYRSVLSAIGRRRTKRTEINSELGQRADRALAVLESSGLIRRSHPVDDHSPKTLRYQLADPYLAFWFRMIDPYQQSIDSGQGRQVIRRLMPTVWQQHAAEVFEEQARSHAIRLIQQGALPEGIVGRWWTDRPAQADIDVVVLGRRWELIGEVKWTDRFGNSEWQQFLRNIEVATPRTTGCRRALWVKGSVDVAVTNMAPDLMVFGPREMVLAAPEPRADRKQHE